MYELPLVIEIATWKTGGICDVHEIKPIWDHNFRTIPFNEVGEYFLN